MKTRESREEEGFLIRLKVAIGSDSVRAFAIRAGLNPSTLQNVLAGTSPTLNTLRAISSAASVSAGWLIEGRCQTVRDCDVHSELLKRRLNNFQLALKEPKSVSSTEELTKMVEQIENELEVTAIQKRDLASGGRSSVSGSVGGADEWLMSRVVDGIQRIYKEAGASLPPASLGELAARIHNEIAGLEGGEDVWRGALALALGRLKAELTEAATTGTGKSSASS